METHHRLTRIVVGTLLAVIFLSGSALAYSAISDNVAVSAPNPSLSPKQKEEATAIAKRFAGAQGPEGKLGPRGATGATGSRGERGSQGERGAQGPKGDPGPQGPKGDRGPEGPPGKDGGGEPPAEEPPVEEPPVEEPEEEPPVEEPPHEEPTQTNHCFLNPAACGFPAPSDTGTTGTLTPSGSINAAAGQTIKNLVVTGSINIEAPNVTIENVKVISTANCGTTDTCGNYAIRTTAANTVIKHVETVNQAGKTCEHDIRNAGGSVVVEDSYLHACDSNLYDAGTATLVDSYGIGKLAISKDHVENVYFEGTLFVRHSTLLNPIGQTAVVFGNTNGGFGETTPCSNHLTLEGNLFAGGGYTVYPCAHADSTGTSQVVIKNNRFARCTTAEVSGGGGTHLCKSGPDANGYYPHSGDYGLETNYFGTQTWAGNVWDDNGAAINPGT